MINAGSRERKTFTENTSCSRSANISRGENLEREETIVLISQSNIIFTSEYHLNHKTK